MRVLASAAILASLLAQGMFAQQRNAPIENQFVRVLSVTDQPHNKSALHRHQQNRVMIYLDSGDIDLTYAGGKVEHQHWKAGDVAWSPAGEMHTSENVSDRPIRIVEIELRRQGDSGAVGQPPDRTHAVIDNAQVRVYKSSTPPAKDHYVAVNSRTGAVAWDKMPDGSAIVITEIK